MLNLTDVYKLLDKVAQQSPCSKRKVGCVIVSHDGIFNNDNTPTQYKLLAEGWNFHPDAEACEIITKVNGPWGKPVDRIITDPKVIHAEVSAVNDFFQMPDFSIWKPEECLVFVNHQPCSNCLRYIKEAGFPDPIVVKIKELKVTEAKKEDIHAILEQRGSRYGEFEEHAKISQGLKAVMMMTPGWQKLPSIMQETLEMIMHKVARILNGDPMYDDSWVDIVGYTQLVINYIKKKVVGK